MRRCGLLAWGRNLTHAGWSAPVDLGALMWLNERSVIKRSEVESGRRKLCRTHPSTRFRNRTKPDFRGKPRWPDSYCVMLELQ